MCPGMPDVQDVFVEVLGESRRKTASDGCGASGGESANGGCASRGGSGGFRA